MYSVWTKHVKEEDREQFKKRILGSKWLLKHLGGLLNEMEQDLDKAEVNPKTYDLPNWDYRQAHNNGYRQCLTIVKKLIDVDQTETK